MPNALQITDPNADNPLAQAPSWADAYGNVTGSTQNPISDLQTWLAAQRAKQQRPPMWSMSNPVGTETTRQPQQLTMPTPGVQDVAFWGGQPVSQQFKDTAQSAIGNALGWVGSAGPGGASLDNPAFAKWFGKSQVVDATGKPLVVYHGTKGDIEAFDPEKLGSATGAQSATQAHFFTDKPHVADTYAENAPNEAINALARQTGQRLQQVQYLLDQEFDRSSRIQLARTQGRITDDQYKEQWAGFQKNFTDLRTEQQRLSADYRDYSKPSQFGGNIVPAHLKLENPYVKDFGGKEYRDESFNDILTKAKAAGHDGVIFRNAYDAWKMWGGGDYYGDVYAVFDPTQIKSAIGNRGTFSPTDPRIIYGVGALAAGGAAAGTQQPQQ